MPNIAGYIRYSDKAIDAIKGINRVIDAGKALDKGKDVTRVADKAVDAVKTLKKQEQLVEELSKSPSFIKKSKQLLSEGEVTVSSFDEANALRMHTFPEAKKFPGAGPRLGPASDSLFKKTDKIYRTDYLKDITTGRIYGTNPPNPHAYIPHINIKYNKQKYVILIDDLSKSRG